MQSNQFIPLKEGSRYLGILVSQNRFSKEADSQLEGKCISAFMATMNQPFFYADLPISTVLALYRTNIRSIVTYGSMLTKDKVKMEELDCKLLSKYFKPLVQQKQNISDRLIDRLFLRLRIPSLAMDFESIIKGWLKKLRYNMNNGPTKKVIQHSQDTLEANQKLPHEVLLRKHFTRRGGNQKHIFLAEFKARNTMLAPAKRTSRVVDKVTKLRIDDDVLDAPMLSTAEKCSGYRYVVYIFQTNMNLGSQEQSDLPLLMKQDLEKVERKSVTLFRSTFKVTEIEILKSVHARDALERREAEVAESCC